jgi:hypothetical protein
MPLAKYRTKRDFKDYFKLKGVGRKNASEESLIFVVKASSQPPAPMTSGPNGGGVLLRGRYQGPRWIPLIKRHHGSGRPSGQL